jgi:hypothetical protein
LRVSVKNRNNSHSFEALTNGFLLYFWQRFIEVTGQILQKLRIFAFLLEDLPKRARLLPVLVGDVGGVSLHFSNPFIMGDVRRAASDFAER